MRCNREDPDAVFNNTITTRMGLELEGYMYSHPSPILGPILWTPSESLAPAPGVHKFGKFFHF